jgi:rhodanese-related sulfurtransferase
MQDALVFLSSNYPYLFLIGLGYFFTQQTSPIIGLLRGLRFEDSDTVVLLVNQGAKVLDIRDESAYAKEHIKGAQPFPLTGKRPKKALDETTVLYNDHGQLSYQEVTQIKAIGYTNLVILSGGIQAWKQAGYPLKTRSK